MKMADAAQEALTSLGGGPATPKVIYAEIIRRELYTFGAKSPVSVLSGTIRQATEGSPRLKGAAVFSSPSPGSYQLKQDRGCA
jgi:hypothetical protein